MAKYTTYKTEKIYNSCTNPKCDGCGYIDGTSRLCSCEGGKVFTGKTKEVPVTNYTTPTEDDKAEKNKYIEVLNNAQHSIEQFREDRQYMWQCIEEREYEAAYMRWGSLDDSLQSIYKKIENARDNASNHAKIQKKFSEDFGETSRVSGTEDWLLKECDKLKEKYEDLKSRLEDDESDKNIYQYFENL